MSGGTWLRLWHELSAAPEFYRERRDQPLELAQAVAEPVLSIALVTTLVVGIAAFAITLFPIATLAGLPLLVVVTATIGFFYGRRLQWSGLLWREWLVLLAPVLAVWRVVTVLTAGAPIGVTLTDWLTQPGHILDGPFTIGSALLLLAWTQGLGYGRDLAALHPGPVSVRERPEPGSREYWEEDERRHDLYLPAPAAVATRWLRGGLLLAVLSGLAAYGVRQMLDTHAVLRLLTLGAPDESTALPNVLAYMLAGLLLIGMAQSSRLRANWAAGGVSVAPGLAGRALAALLLLIAAALAIALVLPTRYSLGLGDALQTAFGFVAYALAWGSSVMLGLVALLLALIDALLGHHHSSRAPSAPPPAALPPTAHGHPGDLLGSLLFWGVAATVVCYCAVVLWRQAEGRLPALTALRRLLQRTAGLLVTLIRAVVRGIWRGAAEVTTLVRRWGGAPRVQAPLPFARPSLRRLGPRELVAYLYLSIEERARRLGLPRRSGQTASEYSRQLRQQLPDLDPDLSGLTELFLEARYSPHPFEQDDAQAARGLWQRVRARLRARRV